MEESRSYNPEYYDAFEWPLEDVQFYSQFVTKETDILELGSGTGRVSIPLGQKSRQLTGVEISETMFNQARQKSKDNNVHFVLADITSLTLGKKFDLIIAPFRVLQSLEGLEQVDRLFAVIQNHLELGGTAILSDWRETKV